MKNIKSWRDINIGEELLFKPYNKIHKILNIEQEDYWTNKQCFLITYEEDGEIKQHTPDIYNYYRLE